MKDRSDDPSHHEQTLSPRSGTEGIIVLFTDETDTPKHFKKINHKTDLDIQNQRETKRDGRHKMGKEMTEIK